MLPKSGGIAFEEWKKTQVSVYGDFYSVSSRGRVKSHARIINRKGVLQPIRERILQQADSQTGKGYLVVGLHKGGKQKTFQVHRLVAESFIPNPENKPEVNHKNGDTKDNRAENLEWVDRSEQMKHAYQIGLLWHLQKGEDHPSAKLSDEDVKRMLTVVLEIKKGKDRMPRGSLSYIASMFGVSECYVSAIANGKLKRLQCSPS